MFNIIDKGFNGILVTQGFKPSLHERLLEITLQPWCNKPAKYGLWTILFIIMT